MTGDADSSPAGAVMSSGRVGPEYALACGPYTRHRDIASARRGRIWERCMTPRGFVANEWLNRSRLVVKTRREALRRGCGTIMARASITSASATFTPVNPGPGKPQFVVSYCTAGGAPPTTAPATTASPRTSPPVTSTPVTSAPPSAPSAAGVAGQAGAAAAVIGSPVPPADQRRSSRPRARSRSAFAVAAHSENPGRRGTLFPRGGFATRRHGFYVAARSKSPSRLGPPRRQKGRDEYHQILDDP